MNIEGFLTELRGERQRIDSAIAALEQIGSAPSTNGATRPTTKYMKQAPTPIKRRTMSASARRKISQAQKARWAKHRKTPSAA